MPLLIVSVSVSGNKEDGDCRWLNNRNAMSSVGRREAMASPQSPTSYVLRPWPGCRLETGCGGIYPHISGQPWTHLHWESVEIQGLSTVVRARMLVRFHSVPARPLSSSPVNAIGQNYYPCKNASAEAPGPGRVRECGANACCQVPLGGGEYNYIGWVGCLARHRWCFARCVASHRHMRPKRRRFGPSLRPRPAGPSDRHSGVQVLHAHGRPPLHRMG